MASHKAWYRKYKSTILQFVLIAITTVIIFALLPSERSFRYEFREGAPWFDEDLIAPFNFPIYKTEAELKRERDSLDKHYPLFFSIDTIKITSSIRVLHNQIHKALRLIKNQRLADVPENIDSVILNLVTNYKSYLANGVTDTAFTGDNLNRSVIIMNNNLASEYLGKEIPQKRLGTFQFRKMAQNICGTQPWVETMTRLIPQSLTQVSSVDFDSVLTKMNLQRMQDEMSLSRGMVQKGQRIVSKGDVITQKEYIVLESLKAEYKSRGRQDATQIWLFVGRFLTSLISAILLISFMVYFRKELLQYNSKLVFVIFLSLISLTVAHFVAKGDSIDIYLIPFAIVPILIRVFFDARFAILIYSALTVIMGLFLPNPYEFVFTQFIVGIVAVFSLTSIYKRSQIFSAALSVFSAYALVYISISLMQDGDVSKIDWMKFAWFGGNSLLVLWSYPLIYLFEKMFGFLSDVTLVELSESNNPLLRKFNELAPGSFQHSLQVANLAENVILKIGGNPLLARTGAMYHDIGKMHMPQYFIENQLSGYNPHSQLSFEESAKIIISHVEKGVEIAKKYNLPKPIIDFIKTHHGDGIVQYFYRSQLNLKPDEKTDVKKFQYQGPTPSSKEMAVVMLADSVEAASRSLKVVTEESLNELIEKTVNGIINAKQLRHADITFNDITLAKEIFKSKLFNIYHARIEYPEEVQEQHNN
ncbi:MAG: HDIG domain-containing protein [Bacteroidales bacterium]|jgi:putative nucleotidyltransferase with HDIG domain|nr:HDIG domain-containing protein [Bacteroidales bacterium]